MVWRLSRRVKIEHDDRTTVQTSAEMKAMQLQLRDKKRRTRLRNKERRRKNFEGASNGRRGLDVGGRGRRKGGRETGKDDGWVEAQETVMGDWGREGDQQLECWEETGGTCRGQVAGGFGDEGRWGLVAGKVGTVLRYLERSIICGVNAPQGPAVSNINGIYMHRVQCITYTCTHQPLKYGLAGI